MLSLHAHHDVLMGGGGGVARLGRPARAHRPLPPSCAARRRAARPTPTRAAAASDANGGGDASSAADAATASPSAPPSSSSSSPYVFKLGDGDVIFVRPPRRDVGPSYGLTWEQAIDVQLAALRHNDRAMPASPPPPAVVAPSGGGGGGGDEKAAASAASAPPDPGAYADALAHRHPDHGIEVLYRFADFSPFERARYFGRSLDLGQFERFRRVMHSPHFRPLLNHTRATTLSTLRLGERCWRARVEVTGSTGGSSSGLVAPDERVYEWTMVQRLGGVHDGYWFTQSLVAEGNDWSDVLAM